MDAKANDYQDNLEMSSSEYLEFYLEAMAHFSNIWRIFIDSQLSEGRIHSNNHDAQSYPISADSFRDVFSVKSTEQEAEALGWQMGRLFAIYPEMIVEEICSIIRNASTVGLLSCRIGEEKKVLVGSSKAYAEPAAGDLVQSSYELAFRQAFALGFEVAKVDKSQNFESKKMLYAIRHQLRIVPN